MKFLYISLITALLTSLTIQPMHARDHLSEFASSTQQAITEHKHAIAAIGAVTIMGLGAYWWQSTRTAKPNVSEHSQLVLALKPEASKVQDAPKKFDLLANLKHAQNQPAKFLYNAQNQPISLGAAIPTDALKQDDKVRSPESLVLLPLRTLEPESSVLESQHHNDHNAPANLIDKQALKKYLSSDAHYYCTKNHDDALSHVHRGQTTMRDILSGKLTMDTQPFELDLTHADRHAHLNNIISACWYMYSVALTKEQGFTEGSFIVHDDGRLYDYLLQYVKNVNPDNWSDCIAQSTNPYGYCRHSTHLHQYQHQGHHQYGIDIRDGDTLNWWEYWVPLEKQQKAHLPTGKKHILFGKIDAHRTFIKFENDGLYRYDGLVAHAFGAVTSTARKLGIGTNDGPTFRKEHMPKEVVARLKQLIKEHKLNIQTPKTIAEIVLLEKQHPELTSLIEELRNTFDHIEVRHGNEVILMKHELQFGLPHNFNTDMPSLEDDFTLID